MAGPLGKRLRLESPVLWNQGGVRVETNSGLLEARRTIFTFSPEQASRLSYGHRYRSPKNQLTRRMPKAPS
jgi:hypothetical protein